ncbi:MAG: ABC transporter ATP-binding protein [Oscillospiraceae bacterium]|nr:ABC transporter ATP-binding protein [Oscillospiraceae bacterium]
MSETMIRIRELKKAYRLYDSPKDRVKEAFSITGKKYSREFLALNGIEIDVKKGETVGIIGTNGAGKSTLLKIITGVLAPTSGEVEINGKIAALLELGAGFNQEYTGMQNIYLNGRIMGYNKVQMNRKIDDIVKFADIGDFINQPVKTYSSGMFARLAFAVSINVEPDILIVDEALSVGDLFFQNKCFKKFEELKKKGVTILFVSHDIASVRQMCARVLWIDQGIQKKFDQCDLVCDMYMDEKRKAMNEGVCIQTQDTSKMEANIQKGVCSFPSLKVKSSKLTSEKIKFLSCFITDDNGNITTQLNVENNYKVHIVIEFYENLDNLIAGFVFENNKGLPIYDINNYINQKQTWRGVKGEISEIVFEFKLPRIMRGEYIVSAALAQGTQEKHIMLTWLHGVIEATVYNEGYNSSYIEIPSDIYINQFKRENVKILGGEVFGTEL